MIPEQPHRETPNSPPDHGRSPLPGDPETRRVAVRSAVPAFTAARASVAWPTTARYARQAGPHAAAFGQVRAPEPRSGVRLLRTNTESPVDTRAECSSPVQAALAPCSRDWPGRSRAGSNGGGGIRTHG